MRNWGVGVKVSGSADEPPPPGITTKGDEMYHEQITGGMDFLDNYYGNQSWVLSIDLGGLNLSSGCDCILGQLQGSYDEMLEILDLEEEDAVRLGFCINYHDKAVYEARFNHWDQLTEEWRVSLKDRLDQGIEL